MTFYTIITTFFTPIVLTIPPRDDIIKYIFVYILYNSVIIGEGVMFKNKNYVLTILKEGSFSKAAEALYVSQPSLSATVKRIEDKISAPIFDRSTTPVTLTEIGAEYIRCATEIDATEKNFEKFLEDNLSLSNGKIKIGGSSFFSAYILPHLISEFNKLYPNITFELYEDNSKSLMAKIQEGKIDIALDNTSEKYENISTVKYAEEILLLAVPLTFALNEELKEFRLTADDIRKNKHTDEQYAISLSKFAHEPFILLNPENDTGNRARILFGKYRITPNIIFNVEQQLTAYNISSNQLGISFISDNLVKNIKSEKNLCYYRLRDPEIFRKVNFYVKNNHYISNACKKFIDFNTK